MSERITYRTVPTTKGFEDRTTRVWGLDSESKPRLLQEVPCPDSQVLCNGCNRNLWPGEADAVYMDGELHDVYCGKCRLKYFPQAVKEESS